MAVKLIKKTGFRFGVIENPPKLPPGFTLHHGPQDFATVTGDFYLHEKEGGGWELVPMMHDGDGKPLADTDAPRIPIE